MSVRGEHFPGTDQTISAVSLGEWAATALEVSGLRPEDARVVIDSLLFADRRGVSTHGVARLPLYVRRLAHGGIKADGHPAEVASKGAVCVIDGDDSAGAITAVYAVRSAVARAEQHGVGVSLVRAANDIGAAGYYASLLADAGCIGIVACNTDAVMCAPGSATPVLGTNPLAIAVPGSYALLDMATSAAAYGKIVRAADEGREIPDYWAVNEAGERTTDPNSALRGAMLPAGGAKGFGLAFMIDVIAALAGASTSPFIPPVETASERPQDLGLLVAAISPDGIADPADFRQRVTALIDAVHKSGDPGPGSPLIPGEREFTTAEAVDGRIPLHQQLVAALIDLGDSLGLRFPVSELEGHHGGSRSVSQLAQS